MANLVLKVLAGFSLKSNLGLARLERRHEGMSNMHRRLQVALATAGLLGVLAAASVFAQTSDDKKMSDEKMSSDTMSGKKMSQKQMMDKMNAMSVDEKAAMFDKMSEKDKMSAMKMGGHDTGKMSHQETMDMMTKMSANDKAEMLDKMPMDKKMAMMRKDKKMTSMDKDPMDKH
ncbi:MAG: hypothetical protein WA324_19840 [Bryobacteraceae bacterium]